MITLKLFYVDPRPIVSQTLCHWTHLIQRDTFLQLYEITLPERMKYFMDMDVTTGVARETFRIHSNRC